MKKESTVTAEKREELIAWVSHKLWELEADKTDDLPSEVAEKIVDKIITEKTSK